MAEYIDKEKFLKDMIAHFYCVPLITDECCNGINLRRVLEEQPAADVVEMGREMNISDEKANPKQLKILKASYPNGIYSDDELTNLYKVIKGQIENMSNSTYLPIVVPDNIKLEIVQ